MSESQLAQLLLYVVQKVSELGGYTTTIRLVKFLYLIDLEHQRRHGRTLTGLPWVYHLFGPYAFDIPRLGERAGIDLEEEEFKSKKGHVGKLLRTPYPQEFPPGLSFGAHSLVDGILSVWADQETADILSYVYRSEPMARGRRGDRLDFSAARRGTRHYELLLPDIPPKLRGLHEQPLRYDLGEPTRDVEPRTRDDDLGLEEALQGLGYDGPGLTDAAGFEVSAADGRFLLALATDDD